MNREKLGLIATLEAKPEMVQAVKSLLLEAATLAKEEEKTISWFAFQIGPMTFGIFDTFNDEKGREEHLNGGIAKALMEQAEALLTQSPQIKHIDIIGKKT